jgi:dihydrofolate reductase
MAGGGQGRILEDTGERFERADPDRARLRPRISQGDEGGGRHDISVGGPDLAAQALRAGLVDECHFFLSPITVGGGKRALPDGLRLEFELLDQRRFTGGVVHLHYGA